MGECRALYKDKKHRVWELDFLRGVAVIAMCFDHLMYNCSHPRYFFSNFKVGMNTFADKLYSFAVLYWNSGDVESVGFRFWAHYIFVFLFLFLVGTSCAFSRDNTKRGSQLAVVALAFTGATMILRHVGILEDGIIFGILHCIALSILCASAVDIATKKCKILNIYLPLVLGTAIIAVGIAKQFWTMSLSYNYDDSFEASHLIEYIMGTRAYGDDWFGLFPYLGAVLMGMYWGKAVYSSRRSLVPVLDGKWNKPFRFVGRHALLFYLAHQVVITGLVMLIGMCMGYKPII